MVKWEKIICLEQTCLKCQNFLMNNVNKLKLYFNASVSLALELPFKGLLRVQWVTYNYVKLSYVHIGWSDQYFKTIKFAGYS